MKMWKAFRDRCNFELCGKQLDIIAITETWLQTDILDSEVLSGLNYNVYRMDRDSIITAKLRKKCGGSFACNKFFLTV